jgi:periplasmic protein CpxP/Spy
MKIRNFTQTVLTVAGLLTLGTFAPLAFSQSQEQQSNPPAATQPGPDKQGSHMRGHGEKLFADLNLTDEQEAQIKKIHEDAKTKADAVKADSALSDADKKTKLREIRKSAMADSKKVLTAEQQAQLEQKMKERRAAKSQNRPS